MTKVWWHSSTAKIGTMTVRLKHRELFMSNEVKNASIDTIEKAIRAVKVTLALADDDKPKIKAAVMRYFKANDRATVLRAKAILELVQGGLTNGNLSLKTDNSSSGRLQSLGVDAGDVGLIEGYVRNGSGGSKGDIHVSRDYILNNRFQAVRTFIHEASHRFANTDDFDEKGYMEADGSDFREPGITAAQCLKNADSYAYFCMALGASTV